MSKSKSTNGKVKTTLEWAQEYSKLGLPVLQCYRVTGGGCTCKKGAACAKPGKHPAITEWQIRATTDLKTIKAWFSKEGECNVGIRTGNDSKDERKLIALDVDISDGKAGAATLNTLENKFGTLPLTLMARTGSGGLHYVFSAQAALAIPSLTDILCTEAGLTPKSKTGIDVRADGGQIVVEPSNHKSGNRYHWENWGTKIAALPAWLEQALIAKPAPQPQATGAPTSQPKDNPHDRLTLRQVAELVKVIPSDNRNEEWLPVGSTLKTIADWIGGEQAAFELWDEWAQDGTGYGGLRDQQYQWSKFTQTDHPIGVLRGLARENGWTPSEEFQKEDRQWRAEAVRKRVEELTPKSSAEDVRPALALIAGLQNLDQDPFLSDINKRTNKRFSMSALRAEMAGFQSAHLNATEGETDYAMIAARRVLTQHYDNGNKLIRTADKSFWYYNNKYWEQILNEEELGSKCLEATRKLGSIRKDLDTVAQQAVSLLKKLQAQPGDPLRLSMPPLPVINVQNAELWITENWSVEQRCHRPDSYLRFCLNIDYDPDATCPRYDEALLTIFQDSPEPEEMRRHLYEVYGYAIQPERDIKQFQCWEGGGENGKTGVVDTLCAMVGKHSVFPGDIRKIGNDYHMAHLKAKLILRDDDVGWNTVLPDGLLKQLSEGKLMLGRDPYGRPKEFTSCALPILLCNKYPITRDLSHGVIQRAHIIPFRHKFVDGKDMKRGLFKDIWKHELPGILNQSIKGLQRLRERGGYKEPKDCVIAKQEFLRQANPLPRFLASDACVTTLERMRQHIEDKHAIDMDLFKNKPAELAKLKGQIQVEVAKAEKAGLGQTLKDFYTNFWQWCRNEGIGNEKPRRADVENYLNNLGYPVVSVHNQKWVKDAISFNEGDQRPGDAM